jgi:hypothetical protein
MAVSRAGIKTSGSVLINTGSQLTINPSSALHISGTLRLADGGEACDADRAGAIKYASGVFSFCNGSAWQTLAAAAAGGGDDDRIVSGTTNVTANSTGFISLTTGGSTTGYFDTLGRLIVPGISTTSYPASLTNLYVSGNSAQAAISSTNISVTTNLSAARLIATNISATANASAALMIATNASVTTNLSAARLIAANISATSGLSSPLVMGTNISVTGNATVLGNSIQAAVSATNISASANVSAVKFIGDGSLLTGVTAAATDRITSGTTNFVVISTTGYISLTQAGSNTGWFDPTRGLVTLGVSSTGPISGTAGYFAGRVGIGRLGGSSGFELEVSGSIYATVLIATPSIYGDRLIQSAGGNNSRISLSGSTLTLSHDNGSPDLFIASNGAVGISTTNPSTSLHVSGTLRLANGGEACDANRIGGIRYTANEFSFCRNGTAWESLSSIVQGTADRITSGTTQLVAISNTGYISLTQAGSNTGWFDPTRGLVTLGVSSTGTISGTGGYFSGNVGVGTFSPLTRLAVASGAVRSSVMHLDGSLVGYPFGLNFTGGDGFSTGIGWRSQMLGTNYTLGAGNIPTVQGGVTTYTVGYGISMANEATTDTGMAFWSGSGTGSAMTEKMRLTNAGNLGIGTSTPSTKLEVVGAISASNIYATSTVAGQGVVSATYGYFRFISGSSINGTFSGDGSGLTGVTAGSTDRITSGTTSLVAISTTGYISLTQAGSNTGWFDPTRGLVTLGVSSTGTISGTRGYFSGNVGVGATHPFYPLIVYKADYTSKTVGANILARLQSNASGADATLQFSDGVTYANTISMKLGNIVMAPTSGNVGIGNSTPSDRLTIGSATDATWNGLALINNSVANVPLSIALSHVGLTSRFMATDASNGSMYFGANSSAATNTGFANAAQMTITNGGNVGIGTTNPVAKLDVSGTVHIYPNAADNLRSVLSLHPNNIATEERYFAGLYSEHSAGILNLLHRHGRLNLDFSDNTLYPLAFRSANWNGISYDMTERMRIDGSTGNVGIGTSAPTTKLEVVGAISASNIYATSTVAGQGVVSATYGYFRYISASVLSGAIALDDLTDAVTNYTTSYTVFVGSGAGASNKGNFVTGVGMSAAGLNSATSVTGLGHGAAYNNRGTGATAVGESALFTNTGVNSTGIGFQSGYLNTGAGFAGLGMYSGFQNSGNYVTGIGYAGAQQNSGTAVTAIGYAAALQNTGSNVTGLGFQAAYQNTGGFVTGAGMYAAFQNSGSVVTAMGTSSAYQNTGSNVTALGYATAYQNTANNLVAIGYEAGVGNAAANQFIVKHNAANTIPLMQGDFATGNLGIGTTSPTAKLQVSGTLALGGTGADTCNTTAAGQLRMNPATKRLEVCRE